MTAGIVLNGVSLDVDITDDYIICADGGYNLLHDWKANCIIGDLDSLDFVPSDIKVIKYDKQKNQTDGELCIIYAVEKGYTDINIYCGLGGRMDHIMGNIALLKLAHTLGARAIMRDEKKDIYYVEGKLILETKKDDIVSVIPFGGNAFVENSKGLMYPLQNLELLPHKTRGISNLVVDDTVELNVQKGGVIVLHYK